MKRTLKILLIATTVIAMLLGLSLTASAADYTASVITVNGGILKLNVLDNFADVSPLLLETPYSTGAVDFISTSAGTALKMDIAAGQNFAAPAYKAWDGTNSSQFVHKTSASDKYYVLNVTFSGSAVFAFEPTFTGEGSAFEGLSQQTYLSASGDDIYLVDNNGITYEATVAYQSSVNRYAIDNIPANFNGYVVIPTSRFTADYNQNSVGSWNSGSLEGYVKMWIMNFYIGGESGTAVNVNDVYYTDQTIKSNTASWIKSIVSNNDGTATVTYVDNFPADTYWTELAIFTQPQTIDDVYDIYNNKCDRGERNATIGNMAENTFVGTIGSGNCDFPYTFQSGQKYYVYIARCTRLSQWDFQTFPYEFTYTEQVEEAIPTLAPTIATTAPLEPEESPTATVTTSQTAESDVKPTQSLIPAETPECVTEAPTQEPTLTPTQIPTQIPTQTPTQTQQSTSTKAPTQKPTATAAPTKKPESVTQQPAEPTDPVVTDAPIEESQTPTAIPVGTEEGSWPEQSAEPSPEITQAPTEKATEPAQGGEGGGNTVIIIIAVVVAAAAAVAGFFLGRRKK